MVSPEKRPSPGKDPIGAIVGHRGRKHAPLPRFGWQFGRTSVTRGPATGGLRWYDVRGLLRARQQIRELGPILSMYERGVRPLPALEAASAGDSASEAGSESGVGVRPTTAPVEEALDPAEQAVLIRQTRALLLTA